MKNGEIPWFAVTLSSDLLTVSLQKRLSSRYLAHNFYFNCLCRAVMYTPGYMIFWLFVFFHKHRASLCLAQRTPLREADLILAADDKIHQTF